MDVAIVGGGIVGLFTGYHLIREGASVTIFEKADLGHGSVHAAGLLEPFRIWYNRLNTLSNIKKMFRFLRTGASAIRSIDPYWLATFIRTLGREPPDEAWDFMRSVASYSWEAYRAMAEERNDFEYGVPGFIELYRSGKDLEAALAEIKRTPLGGEVETVEWPGYAGAIRYSDVAVLSTERFIERMRRELAGARVVAAEVTGVDASGRIFVGDKEYRYDVVVVAAGVWSRRLGLPVAPFKGFGWRVKSASRPQMPTFDVEGGYIVVPFSEWTKVTGGFDLDGGPSEDRAALFLERARNLTDVVDVVDFAKGYRPCTPDGFPILLRDGNMVVATGNCRLGWSYGPAMGKYAADLALGRAKHFPYMDRYRPTTASARRGGAD